jgi:hypothetical protein
VKRRLLNLAAAVSLVLCVATIVLWLRSYWYQSYAAVASRAASAMVGAQTSSGELLFIVNAYPVPFALAYPFSWGEMPADRQTSRSSNWVGSGYYSYEALGFGVSFPSRAVPKTGLRRYVAAVPLWIVAGIFAVTPIMRALRTHRDVVPGVCATCGYDLRATPQRCPECGTPATQAKPQPAEGAAA